MIQVFWGVKMWTGSHGHLYKTEQSGRSCHSVVFWIRCCQHIYFTKHVNVTLNVEHHKELIWMHSFEMKIITVENLMSCCGTVREMVCVWEILEFYCPFSSASHSHLLLRPICEGVCQYIILSIHLSLLQSDHLFLSLFPQSSVSTAAISMTFTAFSGTHSLLSSKLQSTECIVQYYCGVWWKTVIHHHVQNNGTRLILLHSVTVHWPDRDADQKAGCSSRAVWYGLFGRPRHRWQDS